MDLGNPLRSLLGRAPADVLRVLSRVDTPLIGRRVETVSGLPKSSAARALQHLEGIGIVDAEQVGRARRYSVNREHLLWPAIASALDSGARLEQALAARAAEAEGVSLAVYGSVARGEADGHSDVDLLLVHGGGSAQDLDRLVVDLQELVRRASGNDAEVYVISSEDLRRAVRDHEPIVASWRKEARRIAGPPIDLESR